MYLVNFISLYSELFFIVISSVEIFNNVRHSYIRYDYFLARFFGIQTSSAWKLTTFEGYCAVRKMPTRYKLLLYNSSYS